MEEKEDTRVVTIYQAMNNNQGKFQGFQYAERSRKVTHRSNEIVDERFLRTDKQLVSDLNRSLQSKIKACRRKLKPFGKPFIVCETISSYKGARLSDNDRFI
jgi:hypothetical protein